MKPVIALVGRPNVGKSTLFNCLTRSRDALVADYAGLTRDRKYGEGVLGDRPYLVIDTGGLSGEQEGVDTVMAQQARLAIAEADRVLFLVDGRGGMTSGDQDIADYLRQSGKPVTVVVNKTDGVDPELALNDFYSLGLGEPLAIAAVHGRGVTSMISTILEEYPLPESSGDENAVGDASENVKVAIIGRPNVGKSTLVNRLLGEERVVVFDMPGTTRDSIYIPFERDGRAYTLIDTAGVRRKSRVDEAIEKFSIVKTLQAISDAHVVIMVLDAREGISEQDAHLLGFAMEAGRALVIAINKWDGLSHEQKDRVRDDLQVKLPFLTFAKIHYISALHGTGVGDLFGSVRKAYESAMRKLATPMLTKLLEDMIATHQPPLSKGRRIKLRYAHQGGKNPPLIVIHGNQVDSVPESYKRYLENGFRKHLRLEGTPIRIDFKGSDNPFAPKRNLLSPLQKFKQKKEEMTLKRRLKGREPKQ